MPNLLVLLGVILSSGVFVNVFFTIPSSLCFIIYGLYIYLENQKSILLSRKNEEEILNKIESLKQKIERLDSQSLINGLMRK